MPDEFIIWGVPPDSADDDEVPLLTTCRTRQEAQQAIKLLASRYGCRNMRIQHIDGSLPDFASSLTI